MIDRTDPKGAHAIERLERERTGWLTTVTPQGQPQTMPVWFLWGDGELVVYGRRRAARNENLAANRRVGFVLNTDDEGEDLVIVEGDAEVIPDERAAARNDAYVAKYRTLIEGYGWTPESFSDDYPHTIRIRPTRVRVDS